MNTQLKHLITTARPGSSTDTGLFVPELRSQSRARPGVSRVIDIREWADGQAFPVHILQGKSARAAALPLSFSGRLQYG
jgi:hypothetical protein